MNHLPGSAARESQVSPVTYTLQDGAVTWDQVVQTTLLTQLTDSAQHLLPWAKLQTVTCMLMNMLIGLIILHTH